jgi:protoporphyrinogen oxidase
MAERWGVVGGGMLGLTLALRLRRLGHEVTLFEGAPHLGGLASAWQLGDLTWDRHYHVMLLSDSHLREIVEELGLADEVEWVETRTGCYADGELYSVSNTLEFLKFPPLRMIDKLRLGWTIFHGSRVKDWRKLEQVSVEAWLTRHSGKRTFEQFWRPLLRSKLGDNYRIASAAFIWAIIQRLYAARRTGLKKEMFGYVRGGYARLLERFGEHLDQQGVDVRLGARVERVASSPTGPVVQVDGHGHEFDGVVVTAAAPIAARLIDGLAGEEKAKMEAIEYQGIVCASVLSRRPLAGYYVTNITDEGMPYTGVIEMSALVKPEELAGRGLVYLPKYTVPSDQVNSWTDDEVEDSFLSALATMYPNFSRSDVEAFRVSRVRYVLPIATLGYSHRVPEMATSVPGVFAVNSSQIVNGTLNVNETVQLANRAMEILGGGGDVVEAAAAGQAGDPS